MTKSKKHKGDQRQIESIEAAYGLETAPHYTTTEIFHNQHHHQLLCHLLSPLPSILSVRPPFAQDPVPVIAEPKRNHVQHRGRKNHPAASASQGVLRIFAEVLQQGPLYKRIIDSVIESSRTDFEENGIENKVLVALQEVSSFVSPSQRAATSHIGGAFRKDLQKNQKGYKALPTMLSLRSVV